MMRALSVVVMALVCAAWFSPVNACVETRVCPVTSHWDAYLCTCVPNAAPSGPTTAVPTTATPTAAPVPVSTLTFNLTLTSSSTSDARVTSSIISSMRRIAKDADIAPSDVLICSADVHRLTRYTRAVNSTAKTSVWRVSIGFSGRANQEDPLSGEETEVFSFLAQASQEQEKMKIKLKLMAFPTPAPVQADATAQATVDDVTMEEDGNQPQELQFNAADAITSTQATMTIQTCDDGTTIAATATCPTTGSAVASTPSGSSSSPARVAMIIAPVVGGAALLLVLGVMVVVARRRAAAVKAVQQMAIQQDQAATRV